MRNHTTFERTQTVHDLERIKGFRVSLYHIIDQCPPNVQEIKQPTVQELTQEYIKEKSAFMRSLYSLIPPMFPGFLARWLKGTAREHLYGFTLWDIFKMTFYLTKKSGQGHVYLKRLKLEMGDEHLTDEICFTGKALRIINAAVGIIDGLFIGLSPLEHVNNLAIALQREMKGLKYSEDFQPYWQTRMQKILDKYDITDQATREAFLSFEGNETNVDGVQDQI